MDFELLTEIQQDPELMELAKAAAEAEKAFLNALVEKRINAKLRDVERQIMEALS